MNYYSLAGCLLMVGLLAGCQSGEKNTLSDKGENVFPVSTHRALNPIAPPGVFIADPEVRQMPTDVSIFMVRVTNPVTAGVRILITCFLLPIW